MNSGNSASMQPSSGDDEEYDSSQATESISGFLTPIYSTGHVSPLSHPPPLVAPLSQQPSFSIFDQLSDNYFDPSSLQNLNSLDMASWSKTLRSVPNCTEIKPMIESPSPNQTQQWKTAQENATRGSSSSLDHQNQSQTATTTGRVARNPKKRSRASRRALTTVLTTDTTNFRAMVQEFTGVPATPFVPACSPFRSRANLFGTGIFVPGAGCSPLSISSIGGDELLDPLQSHPHLSRPTFSQKIQFPPALSSQLHIISMPTCSYSTSGMHSSSATSSTAITTTNIMVSSAATYSSVDMESPILSYPSLLQPSYSKYPSLSSTIDLGSTETSGTGASATDLLLRTGPADEFGLGHAHLAGLLNLVPLSSRGEGNTAVGLNNVSQDQTRIFNYTGAAPNSHEGGNGTSNVGAAAPSWDYHSAKWPENITARSEGMVQSWNCPSD